MIWWLMAALLCFGLGAILGAPYLPIHGSDADKLLDLADVKPGQRLIDLGSGDGKLLVAAAKRGIHATGYEINPILWLISYLRLRPYRKLARVYCRNFWRVALPPADVIYVFLIERYMVKLDDKMNAEVHTPTKLISYVFQIPGRSPVRSNKNSYVYDYPNS